MEPDIPPTKLFVTHAWEDLLARAAVAAWASSGLLGDVEVVGPSMEPAVTLPLLEAADAVLVLLGEDTHNQHRVNDDARRAAEAGKLLLAMRIPATRALPPPAVAGSTILPFTAAALREAIARGAK